MTVMIAMIVEVALYPAVHTPTRLASNTGPVLSFVHPKPFNADVPFTEED